MATRVRTSPAVKSGQAVTRKTAKKAVASRKTPPPAKPVATVVEARTAKPKKPKLVRDSFTIPKSEYQAIDTLKLRAAKLAHPIKKSELLRAGLKSLEAMSDTALLAALKAVPSIKTGRPKKV